MNNSHLIAMKKARHSVLLGALSTALSLDLPVAPMVLSAPPGCGFHTITQDLAKALDMSLLEMRCATMSWSSEEPKSMDQIDQNLITQHLSDGKPAIIHLCDAYVSTGEALDQILKQIANSAQEHVVVMFSVLPGEENNVLDAVVRTLGIKRGEVPFGAFLA